MKKREKGFTTIRRCDPSYPFSLETYLGDHAPAAMFALGNLEILSEEMFALFCSVKCPGNLILQTYDLARKLRGAGVAVISGFHSPMEKECLALLLRGKQPVVWCPARRLTTRRVPNACVGPLSEGRLLMLSALEERAKRATQEIARIRNEFVAALADRIFVSYAAPNGKTEAFCGKVLAWGKTLLTFDSPENASLLAAGAHPYVD